MHYQLCPRCQFRVAANKTICNTCGYSFARAKKPAAPAVESTPSPLVGSLRKVQAANDSFHANNGNFWRTFLGLGSAQPDTAEARSDEPALGET